MQSSRLGQRLRGPWGSRQGARLRGASTVEGGLRFLRLTTPERVQPSQTALVGDIPLHRQESLS